MVLLKKFHSENEREKEFRKYQKNRHRTSSIVDYDGDICPHNNGSTESCPISILQINRRIQDLMSDANSSEKTSSKMSECTKKNLTNLKIDHSEK